ncbi:EMC6-like membrane protein [Geoglobus acetivorans]|uniref:Permease n=1 Tax=Geoglobus acetivorans TaxID=565033 RepID=A0A0A7GDV6_GEOAI|nr:hypothetical protein GACE_1191 [Geoglobus acetivorans]
MEKNLLKTFVPLIVGIFAGVLSYFVTGDLRTRDPVGIIVLVFFIYLHKLILPRYGVEIESKDWVGIGFLTLATWYISWTILLNL